MPAGERRRVELALGGLPTRHDLELSVVVLHGRRPGPRIWLSAALHGDELNGIEVVREVLELVDPGKLRGTVVAVPIVNLYGFLQRSRYLPDRRDLNRSFPGSANGSLAARLAHLFMREVVGQCTHGIDLHTGSADRINLPQVRADLEDPETRAIAEAFGAPVMVHARTRDASLREAAARRKVPVLLYEGGGPERFEPLAIEAGVRGTMRVLRHLHMLPARKSKSPRAPSVELKSSTWVRARRSGILRLEVRNGDRIRRRQRLGVIADAFGEDARPLLAPESGVVIGLAMNPLVYQGDAVVHLGRLREEA